MKKRNLHIRKHFSSILFLLIIGGIIFNSGFFLHSHRFSEGKLVFHAHPFNKSSQSDKSNSQHTHTKCDLQVYNSLHSFVNFDSISSIHYYSNNIVEIESKSYSCTYKTTLLSDFNKGPPSYTLA